MMAATRRVRTHVLLPQETLDAVDRLVGPRRRSEFLAEAAAEKLLRNERAVAARAVMGSLAGAHIPEWKTAESSAAWVRSLREQSDSDRQVGPA
jgi:metal-responsive CopG/Arc/MetJ family transcriptional regulator